MGARCRHCRVLGTTCIAPLGSCGWIEEPRLSVYHLDAESFLLAAHDMDRLELAALDTLQHGRARKAERAHRFAHWHEAIAGFAVEAGHEVIGEPDAPGGAGGQLLAGDDPVIEQAMDGRWRNAKRDRGLLDRQQLALGHARGRLAAGNGTAAAQIREAGPDRRRAHVRAYPPPL